MTRVSQANESLLGLIEDYNHSTSSCAGFHWAGVQGCRCAPNSRLGFVRSEPGCWCG